MRPRSVCESEAPTRQPLFEKLDASVETRSACEIRASLGTPHESHTVAHQATQERRFANPVVQQFSQ